jgi:protein-L-isoaspartate O-methyltransferase
MLCVEFSIVSFFNLTFLANGIIKDQRVHEVLRSVDRTHYCQHHPYMDAPQGIGYGATISAPHMVSMLSQQWFVSLSLDKNCNHQSTSSIVP